MIKTKEQLREQSKEKLDQQIIAVQDDIKTISEEMLYIVEHKDDIYDIAPEVFNILMGIQRDLRFGKDRIRSIYNTLFTKGK